MYQATEISRGEVCRPLKVSFAALLVWPVISLSHVSNLSAEPANVLVHVRSVQAMEPVASGDNDEAPPVVEGDIKCDRSIADLRSKLKQLSFKRFKLVDNERRVISVTRRETIPLTGGETLTVRPLYVDRNRIGVFLDWQDRGGATILNTRMHFTPGESVLTGTDHGSDSGMILAIDVRPSDADAAAPR